MCVISPLFTAPGLKVAPLSHQGQFLAYCPRCSAWRTFPAEPESHAWLIAQESRRKGQAARAQRFSRRQA